MSAAHNVEAAISDKKCVDNIRLHEGLKTADSILHNSNVNRKLKKG